MINGSKRGNNTTWIEEQAFIKGEEGIRSTGFETFGPFWTIEKLLQDCAKTRERSVLAEATDETRGNNNLNQPPFFYSIRVSYLVLGTKRQIASEHGNEKRGSQEKPRHGNMGSCGTCWWCRCDGCRRHWRGGGNWDGRYGHGCRWQG